MPKVQPYLDEALAKLPTAPPTSDAEVIALVADLETVLSHAREWTQNDRLIDIRHVLCTITKALWRRPRETTTLNPKSSLVRAWLEYSGTAQYLNTKKKPLELSEFQQVVLGFDGGGTSREYQRVVGDKTASTGKDKTRTVLAKIPLEKVDAWEGGSRNPSSLQAVVVQRAGERVAGVDVPPKDADTAKIKGKGKGKVQGASEGVDNTSNDTGLDFDMNAGRDQATTGAEGSRQLIHHGDETRGGDYVDATDSREPSSIPQKRKKNLDTPEAEDDGPGFYDPPCIRCQKRGGACSYDLHGNACRACGIARLKCERSTGRRRKKSKIPGDPRSAAPAPKKASATPATPVTPAFRPAPAQEEARTGVAPEGTTPGETPWAMPKLTAEGSATSSPRRSRRQTTDVVGETLVTGAPAQGSSISAAQTSSQGLRRGEGQQKQAGSNTTVNTNTSTIFHPKNGKKLGEVQSVVAPLGEYLVRQTRGGVVAADQGGEHRDVGGVKLGALRERVSSVESEQADTRGQLEAVVRELHDYAHVRRSVHVLRQWTDNYEEGPRQPDGARVESLIQHVGDVSRRQKEASESIYGRLSSLESQTGILVTSMGNVTSENLGMGRRIHALAEAEEARDQRQFQNLNSVSVRLSNLEAIVGRIAGLVETVGVKQETQEARYMHQVQTSETIVRTMVGLEMVIKDMKENQERLSRRLDTSAADRPKEEAAMLEKLHGKFQEGLRSVCEDLRQDLPVRWGLRAPIDSQIHRHHMHLGGGNQIPSGPFTMGDFDPNWNLDGIAPQRLGGVLPPQPTDGERGLPFNADNILPGNADGFPTFYIPPQLGVDVGGTPANQATLPQANWGQPGGSGGTPANQRTLAPANWGQSGGTSRLNQPIVPPRNEMQTNSAVPAYEGYEAQPESSVRTNERDETQPDSTVRTNEGYETPDDTIRAAQPDSTVRTNGGYETPDYSVRADQRDETPSNNAIRPSIRASRSADEGQSIDVARVKGAEGQSDAMKSVKPSNAVPPNRIAVSQSISGAPTLRRSRRFAEMTQVSTRAVVGSDSGRSPLDLDGDLQVNASRSPSIRDLGSPLTSLPPTDSGSSSS